MVSVEETVPPPPRMSRGVKQLDDWVFIMDDFEVNATMGVNTLANVNETNSIPPKVN